MELIAFLNEVYFVNKALESSSQRNYLIRAKAFQRWLGRPVQTEEFTDTLLNRYLMHLQVAQLVTMQHELDDEVVGAIPKIEDSCKAGGSAVALERIASDLDQEYFRLQEEGYPEHVWLSCFKRARAVAAIQFALGDDELEAASECVYEALAAAGNEEAKTIHQLCDRLLIE